jgi:cytochrome c oxidase assembly factor CtaG
VPDLFQQTLRSDLIHSLQHISFLGAALLYWWSLFYTHGCKGYGISLLSLFTTAIHTVLLGALLTIAPYPLYPAYSSHTALWGLTPLEDQQLAGLIMWVPAGIVYIGAALALCVPLLRGTTTPWSFVEDRP